MHWESWKRAAARVFLLSLSAAACAHADADAAPSRPADARRAADGVEAPAEGAPPAQGPTSNLPRGRAIGELSRDACLVLLSRHDVSVRPVDAGDAPGVEMPVLLEGPVDGVSIAHRGGSERHSVIDCRLVVALLAWAPALRAAGVVRIEHFSVYRPGARVSSTGQPSGHAAGLAIDAGIFVLSEDRAMHVEREWTDRRRDVAPCPPPDTQEAEGQRLLRTLVCGAVDQDLFQIVVTPHRDAHHENHVHLEVRPGVSWSHVR